MHFIKKLEIENFKSLSNVKLDCKRINLFVGRPNVGKSNILEALSLFSVKYSSGGKNFLKEFIRYEKLSNLFYDQDLNNVITVKADIGNAFLKYNYDSDEYGLLISSNKEFLDKVNFENETYNNPTLQNIIASESDSPLDAFTTSFSKIDSSGAAHVQSRAKRKGASVKKYTFKSFGKISDNSNGSLNPPYGENLVSILQSNSELRKTIANYFKEYGLELLLDVQEKKLEIQKKVDDLVYKIPYNLIADTLQRIIFYNAAIESNNGSILLFEEPESHSFPPYIRSLAEDIYESKENQFFIATHSPYLFNTLISKAGVEEVNVFVTDFVDHKTSIRQLTNDEVRELLNYGIDVFFNLNLFK